MKNQKLGFTLIELLVVIVIIGILATISTATFSGYFTKARDTERQTFVRNAQQIILADQVTEDSVDYNLAGADATAIEAAVEAALSAQGYSVPDAKNSVDYWYFTDAVAGSVASNFQFFACKEDALGLADTGTLADHAFSAGTSVFVTSTQAATLCASTPVTATTSNTSAALVIQLSE